MGEGTQQGVDELRPAVGGEGRADPRSAPADIRFDPDAVLAQLEKHYGFYMTTLKFTPSSAWSPSTRSL